MLDITKVLDKTEAALRKHGTTIKSRQIAALAEVLVEEINSELAAVHSRVENHGHDSFTRYTGGNIAYGG